MIAEIRSWHRTEPDWREARRKLDTDWGYAVYGDNCHILPNHGLIILALLYGAGDFDESQMIVNTAGWDTDCNAGNLGCLLGIRNGLAAFDGPVDWRGPVADRLFLPTADGGRAVSDAVRETDHIVRAGRVLAGLSVEPPKAGARYHFAYPGSVQGFQVLAGSPGSVANARQPDEQGRGLELKWTGSPCTVGTPVFVPDAETGKLFDHFGYKLTASPALYPGQRLEARVLSPAEADAPVEACLTVGVFDGQDGLQFLNGPVACIGAGGVGDLSWRLPDTGGQPIGWVGLRMTGPESGRLWLDRLDWQGCPEITFRRPEDGGTFWRRAWVKAVDHWDDWFSEPFRLVKNEGDGLLITGCREWSDYRVEADVTPHLADRAGLAIRVQGLQRYIALERVAADRVAVTRYRDGDAQQLAELGVDWPLDTRRQLVLQASGSRLSAWIGGEPVCRDLELADGPLEGAIALTVSTGRTATEEVRVGPCR
jgi:hypothetical protein